MSLADRFTAAAPPTTLDLRQALNDLEHTHSELIAALDAMERATQAPTPDKSDYSNARWKLSVASRNRRSLAGKICQQLMPEASPQDAQTLKELFSADVKMLHESAA